MFVQLDGALSLPWIRTVCIHHHDSLALTCKMLELNREFLVRLREDDYNVDALHIFRLQVRRKRNLECDVVTSHQIHRLIGRVKVIDHDRDIGSGLQSRLCRL